MSLRRASVRRHGSISDPARRICLETEGIVVIPS
jgi:hypothetical protein